MSNFEVKKKIEELRYKMHQSGKSFSGAEMLAISRELDLYIMFFYRKGMKD